MPSSSSLQSLGINACSALRVTNFSSALSDFFVPYFYILLQFWRIYCHSVVIQAKTHQSILRDYVIKCVYLYVTYDVLIVP
jgi:hypothetical protein